jgi:hypothetical protein
MQPHRGTMILVFGILGLIVCFPFGVVAWVMGNTDLKAMDAGTMDPEGRGTTQAGKIIGMIATILTVLSLIIGILFFAVALILPAVASSSSLLI